MIKLQRVLVANRGEIAVRCIHACDKLSLESVAIYTAADAESLHVSKATKSVLLEEEGPSAYTNIERIIQVCRDEQVDAVFPGYGFLSENTDFAGRIEALGIVFVGPSSDSIECMGLKHTARELAIAANVPVVKGSGLLRNAEHAVEMGRQIGFPLMLKASGGGGGMGTQICWSEAEVASGFEYVAGRSKVLFKDSGVFMERYYPECHHIEVQVFGNSETVIHFGERECSIQRRLQKVVEESPSPHLADKRELRDRLRAAALSLTKSINYRSAGTVEFLVDDLSDDFFFLEMNTRLQVEHGISELCYQVDIVELMLRQADHQLAGQSGIPTGELIRLQREEPIGAAIEVRVCCENPASNFHPTSGMVQALEWPLGKGIRVDSWIQEGSNISTYFDSLLGKVMVHEPTREAAITALQAALSQTFLGGIVTNVPFLRDLTSSPVFAKGRTLTTFLEKQYTFEPTCIQVLKQGGPTTVQQARERQVKGYGIPKSGPADELSASVANLLVGNAAETEVLEIVMIGPELLFTCDSIIAVCGADFPVEIDGQSVDTWQRLFVRRNQKIKVGMVRGAGSCCYLAVKGGLPSVASWYGSKSTTPSLGLGGLQGRTLRPGDFLEIQRQNLSTVSTDPGIYRLPKTFIPSFDIKEIYVMHGPHDSDDFITQKGRDTIYSTSWKVTHNCSRTGIQLEGSGIQWSRESGGAAGSHPSNVVEYPTTVPGSLNWTGENPVIFPKDAPDLTGFLSSSTIPWAGLWRAGQLKPSDAFKFVPISYSAARSLWDKNDAYIDAVREYLVSGTIREVDLTPDVDANVGSAILKVIPATQDQLKMTLRQNGDRAVIVDIGFQDGTLRTSVQANMMLAAIKKQSIAGIHASVNTCSFAVEFERSWSQSQIVDMIVSTAASLKISQQVVKSRRLRLPMVYNDPALQDCVENYMQMMRNKAVYLPDALKYLQENNGLESRQSVLDVLRDSSFLIAAVGFMIGTPMLLSLDPCTRILSQKYNPPRTSTPAGTIGSGGRMFCIYSADLPGGYMPVARTLPVWDTFSLRKGFSKSRPWLCEPFDIVSFYPVDLEEFRRTEAAFYAGTYALEIQETELDLTAALENEEKAWNEPKAVQFRKRQAAAVKATSLREEQLFKEWKQELEETAKIDPSSQGVEGVVPVSSVQQGKIWKMLVKPGDIISEDQQVAILESMKMEIPIIAGSEHAGLVVSRILKREGLLVLPGDHVLLLKETDGDKLAN